MRKIAQLSNVLKMGELWALTVVDENGIGDLLYIQSGTERHLRLSLLMKQIAVIAQEELNEKDSIAMQGL